MIDCINISMSINSSIVVLVVLPIAVSHNYLTLILMIQGHRNLWKEVVILNVIIIVV